MSAPLRLRLALVALVAAIQVISVAAVLIVQNRVAEAAMLDRGRAQLESQAQHVRRALRDAVREFTVTESIVTARVQALPRSRTHRDQRVRDAAMLLLGGLIMDADVDVATMAFTDGSMVEMRRGGPSGFHFVDSDGRYSTLGDATVSAAGGLEVRRRGVVRADDPWTRPGYEYALGAGRVVVGYDGATGSLVAVHQLIYGGELVGVVALHAKPSMLASLVREKATTDGGFAALVPRSADRTGWLASGSHGDVLSLHDVRDLRAALREGARLDGHSRFAGVRHEGVATVAAVVPFQEGDFSGDIVIGAPSAQLVAGAGSVVRSWSLALFAGLAAGILVLPLVYRATRPLDALHRRATVDALTGLANRDELMRRGARMLARARRRGRRIAVAVLDLDGFKEINDRHGHHAGDEVLAAFARRLRGSVRRDDLVARLGGDEFVVVLTGDGLDAAEVFERLLEDLTRQPFRSSAGVHRALCTVGLAVAAPDEPIDDVLARADAALIAGKATVKGSVYLAGAGADAGLVPA